MEIREKWRSDPPIIIIDCGASDPTTCLSNAVATGISLHAADLSGLDLRNADLRGADLTNAELVKTDLRGADLSGADLRSANMEEADLRGAVVERPYFFQTNQYGMVTDEETKGVFYKYDWPPIRVHVSTLKDPSVVRHRQGTVNYPGKNTLFDFLLRIVDTRGGGETWFDRNLASRVRTDMLIEWLEERLGTKVGEVLGTGHHGTAYALEDGRVLKLTTDLEELKTMAVLRDLSHQNLIRVYDTFILKTFSDRPASINVIVRDRTGTILNDLPEYADVSEAILNAGLDADDHYTARANMKTAMASEIKGFKKALKRFKGDERAMLEGVIAAAEALYDARIYTIDIHAKNIGLVDGRPVLFDVMSGVLPDYPEVPVDLALHTTENEANAYFRSLGRDGLLADV